MYNDSKDLNSALPCGWEQGVMKLSSGGRPTEVTFPETDYSAQCRQISSTTLTSMVQEDFHY